VVAANINSKTERKVTVHFATGDLLIEWDSDDTVYMTGPAENICEGEILLDLTSKIGNQ